MLEVDTTLRRRIIDLFLPPHKEKHRGIVVSRTFSVFDLMMTMDHYLPPGPTLGLPNPNQNFQEELNLNDDFWSSTYALTLVARHVFDRYKGNQSPLPSLCRAIDSLLDLIEPPMRSHAIYKPILTNAQYTILYLVSLGFTNRQIANIIGNKEKSVTNLLSKSSHVVTPIYQRLDVWDRTQAVLIAASLGLFPRAYFQPRNFTDK